MKQKFKEIQMSKANKAMLETINGIIEEYKELGYTLTLRQLYYQLVSRDIIANEQKQYSKLSRILKEGRLAGVVDWAAIKILPGNGSGIGTLIKGIIQEAL